MSSLFRFLLRHHVFILFILLEVLSLVLVFNYNNYQRSVYLNSSNRITGNIYNAYSKVTNYFSLPRVNQELAAENARLKGLLAQQPGTVQLPENMIQRQPDGGYSFSFVSARLISNSVNRQHNFITLNKGRKDGIKPDQGVISASGVVGVITNVSESFSTGISLLNPRWNISAKLKKNDYFGSLSWDGRDYRFAQLNEIPFHVPLAKGDTIVTSGFSSIFPEGIMLGTIESFEKGGGNNFFVVQVRLSVDFKSVTYVEVIENHHRDEIEQLQKMINDGNNLD